MSTIAAEGGTHLNGANLGLDEFDDLLQDVLFFSESGQLGLKLLNLNVCLGTGHSNGAIGTVGTGTSTVGSEN